MRAALSKKEIIADVAAGLIKLKPREQPLAAETLSTGLPEVDRTAGGIQRGCITEIVGPLSSGKTSLLLSTLSELTNKSEICALVDTTNSLDIASAVASGIDLDRLLWVQCSGNVEHAFKAVDFLLQGGGFGLIALDIGDVPTSYTSRIVSSWWYRFRRAVEDTRTALIVVEQMSCARAAASKLLVLSKEHSEWSETSDLNKQQIPPMPPISNLLRGMRLHVERKKPIYLSEQDGCFAAQVSF